MTNGQRGVWAALGPGILFAAAAVGVSHLVQSTRAGADYGLSLLLVVLLANAVKYPAFRFGPHYAAATGTSLLEGYRKQGRAYLALYLFLTLGTMFAVLAAITMVTAGLALAVLGLEESPLAVGALLLGASTALLMVGRYRLLDRLTKGLVAVLTLATLVSTALVLSRVPWGSFAPWPGPELWTAKSLFFVVALVGWMPSAIDVSVWQSLWTLARRQDSAHQPSLREATLDFHIGYLGTTLLALCFVLLGAGVMHQRGLALVDSPGGFAAQILGLYTDALGPWSRPLIGVAAFAVMFSTMLTVLDGFPRALTVLLARFRRPEEPDGSELQEPRTLRAYWGSLGALSLGALLVLWRLPGSLRGLVDFATTLSFLTAPALSLLNHRAVTSKDLPAAARPPGWLLVTSLVFVVVQAAFAVFYLYVRYS